MQRLSVLWKSRFFVLLVTLGVVVVPLTSPISNSAMSMPAAFPSPASGRDPAAKVRQAANEKMYCPYWYLDRSTTAALEITNNSDVANTVTPTLLVRGAERVSLDPVTLPARGTRRISLNKILKSRVASGFDTGRNPRWGDGSRAGSNWGSAELQGQNVHDIASKILTENESESLAVHSGFYEYGSRSLTAQWWLPTKRSSALFAVQNTSYAEVRLATVLYLNGRTISGPSLDLPGGGSRLIALRDLVPTSRSKELPDVGAVRFVAPGDAGTLLGRTLLLDERRGLSVPFPMRGYTEFTDSTLQLAGAPFGRPAKGLGFSKATRFTTQLLLTNQTDKAISVTVTLDGRNAGAAPVSWEMPVVEIGPWQSRVVDLDKIRRENGAPVVDGHAGVRLTHTGAPFELLTEAVTIDRTLSYSFDNALYDKASDAKMFNAISFNLTGNKNTLLLIKNPSGVPVQAGFRLNYERQGAMRSYRARLGDLKPYELRVVDVRAIRDSGTPDIDGLVLPADVEFGNANIYSDQEIIAGDPNYDSVAGISSSCIGHCFCQPEAACYCDPCAVDPWLCQPPPQCTDTCTSCMIQRDTQTNACFLALSSCEATAFVGLLNALRTCDESPPCTEGETFNEAECNECRDRAWGNYFNQQGVCGGIFGLCMLLRRDCSGLVRSDCSSC
jgi:hypothetical protein